MADFNSEQSEGLITDTFNTKEPSLVPDGSADEAPTLTPETVNPTIEQPVQGDAEQLRQQLEADYRRKTQALADQRRQVEAQQAEIEARRQAFEAERKVLDPYRQFDAMVAADPVLQQVVAERVPLIRPGEAQKHDDSKASELAQMQASMQQMVVSNAEQYMLSKYPDYADNRGAVADAMQDLGVKYPGHDIVKVTKQLEAAYKLATAGKTVEQVRQATEAATTKKVAATRVGAGTQAGGPTAEPEISMRRPDGRMVSYDDLGAALAQTMRRR